MKKNFRCYVLPLLLMLVAPLQTAADDFLRGDCDQNGKVSIDDVTCLINYLLSGEWYEEPDLVTPDTLTITVNGIANSETFRMIKVKHGSFIMGATSEQGSRAEAAEKPAHAVTLTKDYYIGATEVTQELWLAVMGVNPSYFNSGSQRPVEHVNWNQCQQFITKLNEMTGMQFRLPTEAEWEFAARGGSATNSYMYSGSNNIYEVAWYLEGRPQAVATKMPNALGLYDMSGNVAEWCQDWYGSYPNAAVTDPTGPTSGTYRVHRGGYTYPYTTTTSESTNKHRVSARSYMSPSSSISGSTPLVGLRLAL